MLKSKYSIDEQLKNLEDKNVQFNIMSKEEAREYLQNNTYYFKLKSSRILSDIIICHSSKQ